jgi:hypothetical protein
VTAPHHEGQPKIPTPYPALCRLGSGNCILGRCHSSSLARRHTRRSSDDKHPDDSEAAAEQSSIWRSLAAAPSGEVCWPCALSGWPPQPSSSPAAAQARGRRSHPLGWWQALQDSSASSSIIALAYAWLSAPASWDPWHPLLAALVNACANRRPTHLCQSLDHAGLPPLVRAAPARPRLDSSPSALGSAGSRIANGVAPRYSAWLPPWTGLLSRASRALRGSQRTSAAFPNPGPRLATLSVPVPHHRLKTVVGDCQTDIASQPDQPSPARPPSQLGFDRLDQLRPPSSRPPLCFLLCATPICCMACTCFNRWMLCFTTSYLSCRGLWPFSSRFSPFIALV